VRLTTAARVKAMGGLDEVTRTALERAEALGLEDERPLDNVVEVSGRPSGPADHPASLVLHVRSNSS